MFISPVPMAFSMDTVAGLPFIRHLPFPERLISRCISISPSSSSNPFSFRTESDLSEGSEKTALTNAFSQPFLISSLEVLFPKTAFIESIIIDLPAPVSPVSTLSPFEKSMLVFSMTAIFSI